MQKKILMRGYDRRLLEWNLVYRYVRKGYLEGGGHGTLVDVSPNFWPLVEVFSTKNGYFSKFLRYINQQNPKKLGGQRDKKDPSKSWFLRRLYTRKL